MNKITNILYYLGGGIVFTGIVVFIEQHWSFLSIPTKNIATLGSGIAAYTVGILFSRYETLERVSRAFYFISALVIPVGLYVVFYNAGFDVDELEVESLIIGTLLALYLLSYLFFRKNLFLFFAILFGTWFLFTFTDLILNGRPFPYHFNFLEYRLLLAGASYILLGYSFSFNDRRPLTGALYTFGILGFLGAAFALGGWKPYQHRFWELVFPFLTLGAILLSVYLKSKAFLTFGALFLVGYIFKITAEYFQDSLGWPLMLVLIGLTVMVIGYFSFYLHRKYISQPHSVIQ